MREGLMSPEKEKEMAKFEKKATKEQVKNLVSYIRENIERAKEKPEDEEPHLIWEYRLMGDDSNLLKTEEVLRKVFKKFGVDTEKKGGFIEDENHPVYQCFKEAKEREEKATSFLKRKLVGIEAQKTKEPGVTFIKTEQRAINEQDGSEVLITDYSLYTNLETKKESK